MKREMLNVTSKTTTTTRNGVWKSSFYASWVSASGATRAEVANGFRAAALLRQASWWHVSPPPEGQPLALACADGHLSAASPARLPANTSPTDCCCGDVLISTATRSPIPCLCGQAQTRKFSVGTEFLPSLLMKPHVLQRRDLY